LAELPPVPRPGSGRWRGQNDESRFERTEGWPKAEAQPAALHKSLLGRARTPLTSRGAAAAADCATRRPLEGSPRSPLSAAGLRSLATPRCSSPRRSLKSDTDCLDSRLRAVTTSRDRPESQHVSPGRAMASFEPAESRLHAVTGGRDQPEARQASSGPGAGAPEDIHHHELLHERLRQALPAARDRELGQWHSLRVQCARTAACLVQLDMSHAHRSA